MSLDLRQAVAAARRHFQELLPEFTSSADIKLDDIRLEEIEKEGNNWIVTLSIPYREKSTLTGYLIDKDLGFQRLAKILVIDGSNGSLVALRQQAA